MGDAAACIGLRKEFDCEVHPDALLLRASPTGQPELSSPVPIVEARRILRVAIRAAIDVTPPSFISSCSRHFSLIISFGDSLKMLITKQYASADDLHLRKSALLAILSLNESLPDRNGEVWVTLGEFTDRLVHCGVHVSLDSLAVREAAQKHNRNRRLDRRTWKDGGVYFRPSTYTRGSPLDQREGKRPPILPRRNLFKKMPEAANDLNILNVDLLRVKKLRDGIKNGTIKCELPCLSLLTLRSVPCSPSCHLQLTQ